MKRIISKLNREREKISSSFMNITEFNQRSWLLHLSFNIYEIQSNHVISNWDQLFPWITRVLCFFESNYHWSFFTSTIFSCSEPYYPLYECILISTNTVFVAFRKVRMRISTSHQRRTIHNVFGIIKGEIEPGLYFKV
jgi:hypothetical protein